MGSAVVPLKPKAPPPNVLPLMRPEVAEPPESGFEPPVASPPPLAVNAAPAPPVPVTPGLDPLHAESTTNKMDKVDPMNKWCLELIMMG
jgi:hypothetical protein